MFSNIIRWIIGIVLILVVLNYSQIGLFYLFEFIARKLNNLNGIVYFFIWMFICFPIVIAFIQILTYILKFLTLIVRQDLIFARIFGVIMFIFFLATIILFWKGIIRFSWEDLNHKKLNTFLFSFIYLFMLFVPYSISTKIRD